MVFQKIVLVNTIGRREDPDPYSQDQIWEAGSVKKNLTDPEHWLALWEFYFSSSSGYHNLYTLHKYTSRFTQYLGK